MTFDDEVEIARPGYHIPHAPPSSFNVLAATDAELRPRGIPPCPDKTPGSTWARLWGRMFGDPSGFVRARLEPAPHRESGEGLDGAELTFGPGEALTWAGAVLQDATDEDGATGPFTIAYGEFDVPFVQGLDPTPTRPIAVAIWAGLDGWVEDPGAAAQRQVLQAGVTAMLAPGPGPGDAARPNYYFWTEWYVAGYNTPSHRISNLRVGASDRVAVSAQALGPELGFCLVRNLTSGQWTYVLLTPPPAVRSMGVSAEWIVERPLLAKLGAGELPRFTEVSFQDCQAGNMGGDSYGLLPFAESVDMVRLGDTLADAEILEVTGASTVDVTWDNFK
jgi:hypothetical protein